MENQVLTELANFLKSLNEKKNPELVFNLCYSLERPDGFLSKEIEKIFDVKDLIISNDEKLKLIDKYQNLGIITKHCVTIFKKSLSGKDFEKQINFLIKKIEQQTEDYQAGILRQIKEFLDSDKAKKVKGLDKKRITVMANLSATINETVRVQGEYDKFMLRDSNQNSMNDKQ